MVNVREWFESYWPVIAIVFIAVGSVFFFYWVFTMQIPLPPYP